MPPCASRFVNLFTAAVYKYYNYFSFKNVHLFIYFLMPGPVTMASCVSVLCYLPELCSEFCMFTLHEKSDSHFVLHRTTNIKTAGSIHKV